MKKYVKKIGDLFISLLIIISYYLVSFLWIEYDKSIIILFKYNQNQITHYTFDVKGFFVRLVLFAIFASCLLIINRCLFVHDETKFNKKYIFIFYLSSFLFRFAFDFLKIIINKFFGKFVIFSYLSTHLILECIFNILILCFVVRFFLPKKHYKKKDKKNLTIKVITSFIFICVFVVIFVYANYCLKTNIVSKKGTLYLVDLLQDISVSSFTILFLLADYLQEEFDVTKKYWTVIFVRSFLVITVLLILSVSKLFIFPYGSIIGCDTDYNKDEQIETISIIRVIDGKKTMESRYADFKIKLR